MKRILNTFKYGSGETKRLLAITFLAGLATVGFVATAIITHSLLFFFGAIICVFVTISLAQTFGIHEEDMPSEGKIIPAQVTPTQTMPVKEAVSRAEEVLLSEEDVAKKVKVKASKFEPIKKAKKIDRSKKPSKQPKPHKTKASKSVVKVCKERKEKRKKAIKFVMKQQKERSNAVVNATEEIKLDHMRQGKDKPSKSKASKGQTKESSKEQATLKQSEVGDNNSSKLTDELLGIFGDGQTNDVVGDGVSATANLIDMSDIAGASVSKNDKKQAPITEEEKQEKLQALQASDEEIAQYNRTKVKKMLRKYKVKRDHRLVLIDKCEKHSIYQTPAYIWVADNLFHLLLVEKEPRHLTIPTLNIHEVTYLKKQLANEDVDYAAFKSKSMMAELFRPYLPDYTHSTVVGDLSAYKNLYGIGPGIYFTNRSAASLFDLLAVELTVEDKVTTSNKVNVYFKDAYKANIMLRDNVVDANGYADRISNILDSMAHSTISYGEFKDTLNLMQKNKLITAEFAMYYMGVRDKI